MREAYRAEFDAEVQSIVQRRLKGAQEKLRRYEERESALLAEGEQSRLAAEAGERSRALAAAMRRSEAASHFSSLVGAADELRRRVPDFDLMRELENDAFAELTRPGSKVSLEQAAGGGGRCPAHGRGCERGGERRCGKAARERRAGRLAGLDEPPRHEQGTTTGAAPADLCRGRAGRPSARRGLMGRRNDHTFKEELWNIRLIFSFSPTRARL